MLAKHALSQLSYGPVPEDECVSSRFMRARLRLRYGAAAFVQERPAEPKLRSSSGCKSIRTPREFGGARRNRTDDLLLAKQALSQLSYGPGLRKQRCAKP